MALVVLVTAIVLVAVAIYIYIYIYRDGGMVVCVMQGRDHFPELNDVAPHK